ncbi:MAG: RNA methyltransferase, partial [Coprobacillus cateniformis]|nr:RNA methyltransferase [Coprobacillus cateniformis]
LTQLISQLQEKGVVVIGSALENGKNIAQINRYSKMAFVVGNEGNGMNPEVLAKCDDIGYIPINTIESLNVAIAGGIMMYHFK